MFGSKQLLTRQGPLIVAIGEAAMAPSKQVRNLVYGGGPATTHAAIGEHGVSCHALPSAQHQIHREVPKVSLQDAVKSLVHAMINARLDYCNAL